MFLIYRVFLLDMDLGDILKIYQDALEPPEWVPDDMSPLTIPLGHIEITPQYAAAIIHWVLIEGLGGYIDPPASDSDEEDSIADKARGRLALKGIVSHDISGYSLVCTIKATVVLLWDPDQDSKQSVLTIDFARRSGDALCFGEVYKIAREYMNAVTIDSDGVVSGPTLSRSEPVHVCNEHQVATHEAGLQPLVAMLEDSSAVLQQEAITALSAIATTSGANMAVVSSALANSRFKDLVLNTL